MIARVVDEPLSVAEHEDAVADKAAGAVVSFAGIVRDHDGGLVVGHRQRLVGDLGQQRGVAHVPNVPGGTSRSVGSASPVQSTSVTACAAR